jgi:hypothetical protein
MNTAQPVRSYRVLVSGGLLVAFLLVLFLQACGDNPAAVADESLVEEGETLPRPSLLRGDSAGLGRLSKTAGDVQDLLLPYSRAVSSSVPAFQILQDGGGIGIRTEIRNANSVAIALDGVNGGTGHALLAWNYGLGRGAVAITSNSNNTLPALDVSSQSLGINGSNPIAAAADIRANNVNSTAPAVQISTLGNGNALVINHKGTNTRGHIAVFQKAGTVKAYITRAGVAHFEGGIQNAGADVAEAFDVEGPRDAYEPGDVLAISTRSDRKVEKASDPYSTRVIGVYATKPGVLLTERSIDEDLGDMVPVGVLGVIPTKVSAENGRIRRGDLLVSAGTPGHAMRADPERLGFGMVLGKALEAFDGPGTGAIRVLVNVR